MKLAIEIIIHSLAIIGLLLAYAGFLILTKAHPKTWRFLLAGLRSGQNMLLYISDPEYTDRAIFINTTCYREDQELCERVQASLEVLSEELVAKEENYHNEQVEALKKERLG